MQQGRGGIGSRKHGVSGHAAHSPRFWLANKLAAECGKYDVPRACRRQRLDFETVRDALNSERGARRRKT